MACFSRHFRDPRDAPVAGDSWRRPPPAPGPGGPDQADQASSELLPAAPVPGPASLVTLSTLEPGRGCGQLSLPRAVRPSHGLPRAESLSGLFRGTCDPIPTSGPLRAWDGDWQVSPAGGGPGRPTPSSCRPSCPRRPLPPHCCMDEQLRSTDRPHSKPPSRDQSPDSEQPGCLPDLLATPGSPWTPLISLIARGHPPLYSGGQNL